jgi:hypothetical protein
MIHPIASRIKEEEDAIEEVVANDASMELTEFENTHNFVINIECFIDILKCFTHFSCNR